MTSTTSTSPLLRLTVNVVTAVIVGVMLGNAIGAILVLTVFS